LKSRVGGGLLTRWERMKGQGERARRVGQELAEAGIRNRGRRDLNFECSGALDYSTELNRLPSMNVRYRLLKRAVVSPPMSIFRTR
jgi:hypothetical protein